MCSSSYIAFLLAHRPVAILRERVIQPVAHLLVVPDVRLAACLLHLSLFLSRIDHALAVGVWTGKATFPRMAVFRLVEYRAAHDRARAFVFAFAFAISILSNKRKGERGLPISSPLSVAS